MKRRARSWMLSVVAGFSGSLMVAGGNCGGEIGTEFREATRDEFETGVNAILDGVVSGVFEVYDPEVDSGS